MQARIAELLSCDACDVDVTAPIAGYGLESLDLFMLVGELAELLDMELSSMLMWEHPSIEALATYLTGEAQQHRQPPVAPIAHAATLLPSPMQRWLGYACRQVPDSPRYNVPQLLRMCGALDAEALRRALQAIVDRHETLRMAFTDSGGALHVTIRDRVSLALEVHDLSAVAPEERDGRARQETAEAARRPFDIAHDLLVRADLWRLDASTHLLLLNIHHLVYDGWSQDVLLQELAACYNAILSGSDPGLPDLPIRYRDYAAWRAAQVDSEEHRGQLRFWDRQLAQTPPLLEIPTDRPRGDVNRARGGYIPIDLPRELWHDLRLLSRETGVTLFVTLLAAWQTLLYRLSGQERFVVCVPAAGRTRRETAGLIGYFINVLPLGADLSGNPRFRSLLLQVRTHVMDAIANQDITIDALSVTPRLQALFGLQKVSAQVTALQGLTVTLTTLQTDSAQFELGLDLEETEQGLRGGIQYNSDLFDAETIVRLSQSLRNLLASLIADPQQRVSTLSLLSQAERRRLLVERNAAGADYPRDVCLHQLFEAQVERTPESIAVVFQGVERTYRQLDSRANRIAARLRQEGVGPNTLVGICLERSIDMVAGLLGILKAGGHYLPLDPGYPKDRLGFMLDDSRALLTLTQTDLLDRLPSATMTLCLDAMSDATGLQVPGEVESGARGDGLAYVIYTSGSTGKPKGVCVPHCAAVNLVVSMRDGVGCTDRDRLLAVTTLAFDIATLELFLPLTTGACLVIADSATTQDGPRLAAQLAASGATIMQATPATWQMLLDSGWEGRADLKVLCGGEALSPELAQRLLACNGALWNLYGPTETTIWSTSKRVTCPQEADSIGRPIANTRVYVLDRLGQPVPPGMPGELSIGGAGVANGYLRRPELTAERFVPDPFSRDAGARLYRTGDLARWCDNGELQFLGRLDHQVKMRGFRIEPAEIESVLRRHPDVREAIVVVREDAPGDRRLVAYIVSPKATGFPLSEARELLARELPAYMLPSHLIALAALPLAPNGKVDRKALPAPDPSATARSRAGEEAWTPEAVLIAGIWADVLGLDGVGLQDDFFALGGHSLLAVRMMAQIGQVFGRELPLALLLEGATVETLARLLAVETDADNLPTLLPIQTGGSMQPLFCAAWPEVNALGYVFLARALGKDQPVYGLQRRYRQEDTPFTQGEYEALAREYIAAMRTAQPQGPYRLAGMCEGAHIAFEMARQLESQGEQIAMLSVFDSWVLENTRIPALFAMHRLLRRARETYHAGGLSGLAAAVRWGRGRRRTVPEYVTFEARYWPGPEFTPPRIEGRIVVFRVRRQPYYRVRDVTLGWGIRSARDVEVHTVCGDHLSLLRPPHVQALAAHLRICLQHADNDVSPTP